MPPPAIPIPISQVPVSAVDTEGHSTAPTTPDGSLTFSPTLQAIKLKDALETEFFGRAGKPKKSEVFDSLDATQILRHSEVRKVCCIGAGYVGKSPSQCLTCSGAVKDEEKC